jgi:hypothetical protein
MVHLYMSVVLFGWCPELRELHFLCSHNLQTLSVLLLSCIWKPSSLIAHDLIGSSLWKRGLAISAAMPFYFLKEGSGALGVTATGAVGRFTSWSCFCKDDPTAAFCFLCSFGFFYCAPSLVEWLQDWWVLKFKGICWVTVDAPGSHWLLAWVLCRIGVQWNFSSLSSHSGVQCAQQSCGFILDLKCTSIRNLVHARDTRLQLPSTGLGHCMRRPPTQLIQ